MESQAIPRGLATYIGLAFAVLQGAGAIVLYAEGEHSAAEALLTTANANAIAVFAGRYFQAHKAIPATIVQAGTGTVPVMPEAGTVPDTVPELLTAAEQASAQANLSVVEEHPDGVDGPHVPYAGTTQQQAPAQVPPPEQPPA